MLNYCYDTSQNLIDGQLQHTKEFGAIWSFPKRSEFTFKESLYGTKYKILCKNYMEWNSVVGGYFIGVSSEECEAVWDNIIPFTQEMQDTLYRKLKIKISTVRLDEVARTLWKARQIRLNEIITKYKDLAKPIQLGKFCTTELPKKRTLFGTVSLNQVNGVTFKHPLFGLALKIWRGANGQTQYSIAEIASLELEEERKGYTNTNKWSVEKRDDWHKFETQNYINFMGYHAFYMAYGITIFEAIAPGLEYFKAHGLDVVKYSDDFDTLQKKAQTLLDGFECSIY